MDFVELKTGVLRHLRDLLYARALTHEVLPLELTLVAADLGVAIAMVQGAIAELILLEMARPTGLSHLAVTDGDCEITKDGVSYLHAYESARHTQSMEWSWGRAGFDLEGAEGT